MARYYYLKALAVDPRFLAALYNFAFINRYTYPRTAVTYFGKVLAIEPKDAPALYLLGRALESTGHAALGHTDIQRALCARSEHWLDDHHDNDHDVSGRVRSHGPRERSVAPARLAERAPGDAVGVPEPGRGRSGTSFGGWWVARADRAIAPERSRPPWSSWARLGPLGLVALTIGFNLYNLRSCLTIVAYDNDSAMHQEMVRWADERIRAGHVPLDGWFPWLNLGSPHFHHYQSLPHTLTAILGLAIGANRAFTVVLYVLLSLWPIAVYAAGRLFGWNRWACAAAAAMSPLLSSAAGVGYEQISYLWRGNGVWSQLWAMWTLPFAWALGWRAVSQWKSAVAAVAVTALTIAFHFQTGYLALLPLALWVIIVPTQFVRRLLRAAVVGIGSLLTAAWVVVPLIVDQNYAAQNEFTQHTYYSDSFGARKILGWLIRGKIYDNGHLPVISALVALGIVVCITRFLHDERSRAILAVWLLSLVLFFGRPTLGPLINLLPGSHDLFLRRFVAGVELSGLFLAGIGAAFVVEVLMLAGRTYLPRLTAMSALRRAVVAGFGILVLAPAWTAIYSSSVTNAQEVSVQQGADATAGASLNVLIRKIEALDAKGQSGRVYAGLWWGNSWAKSYTVGYVPVAGYLASQDVDEVGFVLRTASLMSDVEPHFDEYVRGDYEMFGIRYLLLPSSRRPSISGARLIARSGTNDLYEIGSEQTNGYVQVVDTFDWNIENRTDIGTTSSWMMTPYKGVDWAARALYPTVVFNGGARPADTLHSYKAQISGSPGRVVSVDAQLDEGRLATTVVANRRSVVLLKASYDPRWTATVDGVPVKPEMIAPALVGVVVGKGVHHVVFLYKPVQYYDWLLLLGLLTLLAIGFGPKIWRRLDRRYGLAPQRRRARPGPAER